ncbi:DUF2971 domain-containing protein [Nitrosomonas oligotropha]|uniref:DUF2971 domain-containing protein n=1 Tax=Nitrosomonas oligotropha TaxID=42354 RepID=A0A1H8IZI1_9PROT|nr:DUF2971 domain-containing protein [Nitrosomonas oligotropha]SDW10543.1 Protein of unknown function [Nitrosomonas oligotropha]SEN73456.1 Protein of unknown function [Nitrosomonas oligotropha]
MISEEFECTKKIEGILLPAVSTNKKSFYGEKNHARFVHYTSSESALKIINTKQLWMRNTMCMSDFREVNHGFELLNSFFLEQSNQDKFSEALNSCSPGIAEKVFKDFNQWLPNIRMETYIASVSEHDDKEDDHGRLSMWRAFGGSSTRVAIVFKVPNNIGLPDDLVIGFNPVSYLEKEELHSEINTVIERIEENQVFLRSIDPDMLIDHIFTMLLVNVTCLKHHGFQEEREWRIFYYPKLWSSMLIEQEVVVVGSVPQIVHKLPLNKKMIGIEEMDFCNIFDRLIIGPSEYPLVQFNAFVYALQEIGIHDAQDRVVISGIPIRA